jgi:hypothetical protein
MLFKKKSLLFALTILSVGSVCFAQAQSKRKVSLLVAYMDKGSGIGEIQHIERFDFLDGELVSRKRVVTLNHETDGYAGDVVRNRYLRTVYRNKIFDLQEGRFIESLPGSTEAIEKAKLLGRISPDGTKSVDAGVRFGSTDKLEIHFVEKPAVVVKGNFRVTVSKVSSSRPHLPLLWIDNDRILTQKSNGSLVIVSTDGTVSPFLQLPCKSDDYTHLERNKSGRIVYDCSGRQYLLDVEDKNYEKIKRELGDGFALDFVNGESIYYYNDKEIGRDGLNAVAIKSYLAMLYGVAKNGMIDMAEITTIKVWNETTKAWTEHTIDGWGAKIIGWIEE